MLTTPSAVRPSDHRTQMVTFKRSWWFNLKQSRINSNLLAAHQAARRGLDLVYCVQMLLLFPVPLSTAGGHVGSGHTVTMVGLVIQIPLNTGLLLYWRNKTMSSPLLQLIVLLLVWCVEFQGVQMLAHTATHSRAVIKQNPELSSLTSRDLLAGRPSNTRTCQDSSG